MTKKPLATIVLTGLLCAAVCPADTTGQYLSYPMTADLKAKLETVLQDHAEILSSLPHHPLAPAMLEEVKNAVSGAYKIDNGSAARFIVEHFCDSDLGLYALSSRLTAAHPQDSPTADPCVQWCLDHPNTRVACLAFDRTLSATSDAVSACEEKIRQHPGTRIAAFAGLRLAEHLTATGDFLHASDALLGVLQNPSNQAVSDTAARRARQIWHAGGQWMAQCIMDAENTNAFVPPSVVRRLSEHLAVLNDPSLPEQAPLTAALWNRWPATQTALESFSVDERLPVACRVHVCLTLAQYYAREGLLELATANLERALEGFTAEPAKFPARVELAFAAFSLDAAPKNGTARPRSMEHAVAELLLSGRLETAQRAFLDAVSTGLQRLPVDDQVYYALRIAERQEREFDVPAAAKTLRAALSVHGGHPALVKRLETRLARIQLVEYYSRWRPEPVAMSSAGEEGKEAP